MRWRSLRRCLVALSCVASLVLDYGQTAVAQQRTPTNLEVRAPAAPSIDLVFVLDATSSMGDEIEPVKQQLWAIAQRVGSGTPRPALRVGLVLYRDRGDAEPSRVVPLTTDLDLLHRELMSTQAVGGGDVPEDVNNGLALAVREMQWNPRAAHLLFLVGDAPPHDYPGQNREQVLREAARQEIEINTIECSGMDAAGHALWASLAQRTNGLAQVLTYSQQYRMADGQTRTLLRQGSQNFVVTRALSDAERSLDASELVHRGAARALSGTESEGLLGSPAARSYRGGAPARPAAAAVGATSNNIAESVTRRVQRRASDLGVSY